MKPIAHKCIWFWIDKLGNPCRRSLGKEKAQKVIDEGHNVYCQCSV